MKLLKPLSLLLFALTLFGMIIFEQQREGFTLALGLFATALFLADLLEGESCEGRELDEY